MNIDFHDFSKNQCEHAISVLTDLFRRRFFLYKPDGPKDRGYVRNPDVFRDLLQIQDEIEEEYRQVKLVSERSILYSESERNIIPPDLGSRSVVQCNRYNSGLDICTAWPLSKFEEFVPRDLENLKRQLFNLSRQRFPITHTGELVEKIMEQLDELDIRNPDNLKTVVVLKSRFDARGDKNGDLMEGKVSGIQSHAEALGYLLYRSSLQNRLLEERNDPSILCSTARESYVWFFHPSRSKIPQIEFNLSGDHPRSLHFATVL